MKRFYILSFFLLSFFYLKAQNVVFGDNSFRYILVNNDCVDTDNDGIYDSDADTNDDDEIQFSEAEAVIHLNLPEGTIDDMTGLEAFTNLETLNLLNHHNLHELDVSFLPNLTRLYSRTNGLNSVNVAGLSNLQSLQINDGSGTLTDIDLSGLTSLEFLFLSENQITTLDVSALTTLEELYLTNGELNSLNVDGLINLNLLNCSNNMLSTLDTSDLISLEELNIGYNQIPTVDLSISTNLRELKCYFGELQTLDLSGLINLETINCYENPLTELQISGLTSLIDIECGNTQLSTIDLNGLPNLTQINATNCQLITLDTSMLPSLTVLSVENNQLDTIDLSSSINLESLNINNNMLNTMFLKNGSELLNSNFYFNFSNNPNISYICIDDFEFESVNNRLDQYGITNCVVNSYCSFVPGGTFYTIEGENSFDIDTNGCDDNDPIFPNLKYTITDGTITGEAICNATGAYFIPVLEGIHTLTPVFENPDYFTSIPNSITIDLPIDGSPFNQDFCVVQNGMYDDLEILIIPLESARPGFDTDYKIVYINKGSTTLSGYIEFDFTENDGLMDFVSSTPIEDSFTNNILTWNYTDLQPFESREIFVTLNMNSPMETPPLNGGENIGFVADIYPKTNDETIYDNKFALKQIVVNSYDPNDKTCLEGTIITPEQVGEYLHYLIRFENTGTASAINIVVKDNIDLSKLDISTLVPLHSSHDFITRITDNVVEFIFEDIQLPFDDANNDGFITFKIKPVNSLQIGDTIDNNAEIYFDFNFPIITNISQVTVAVLSIEEYEMDRNAVDVYPNPVKNTLHLKSNNTISSVDLYNLVGQQILNVNPDLLIHEIDMSKLNSGIYLIKININEQIITYKVIKE